MKKMILFVTVMGAMLCFVFSFCTTSYAQKPLDVYYHVATTEKVIALTFDDGPHPRFTDEILNILEKENIRATFFAIGSNVEAYPDVMRRVMASGHEIGNHTYNHPIVHTVTDQQLVDEIEKTDEILRNMGYQGNGLFRPPQGKCPDTMPALLERTNKTAILWNIGIHPVFNTWQIRAHNLKPTSHSFNIHKWKPLKE
jgi:peptidoglycan/xylan/chitin deacetylase (PgdA/CDA1 family)